MVVTLTCWKKWNTGLIKQMVYADADIVEIKAVHVSLSRVFRQHDRWWFPSTAIFGIVTIFIGINKVLLYR